MGFDIKRGLLCLPKTQPVRCKTYHLPSIGHPQGAANPNLIGVCAYNRADIGQWEQCPSVINRRTTSRSLLQLNRPFRDKGSPRESGSERRFRTLDCVNPKSAITVKEFRAGKMPRLRFLRQVGAGKPHPYGFYCTTS